MNCLKHALALALLALFAPASAAEVTQERIGAADALGEGANWFSYGRGHKEQRFSPLKSVSTESVGQLGLAWSFDVGNKVGMQATPLVVDGVLYVSSGWGITFALDAATGDELWRFDPEVPRDKSHDYCCGFTSRGVGAWGDKIYLGTLDGRLIALDAKTGAEKWSVRTFPADKRYSITGAPRVVKDKVLIGYGGAEFNGTRGSIGAFDAETGEEAWRFYTVPGNPADGFENAQMEKAAKTWTGEWWKLGGGGTVWDSMAYDAELDLLFIGSGNGTPHNKWLRSPDGGDNLFLCSLIALRPDTGEYVWHYQEIPAETWDFTATQSIVLADIDWAGETRKVLMHAPKAGFFYILDRATGELLSAEKYAREVTWASHYDIETRRPVIVAGQDFADGTATVRPIGLGAHNWHPMSYSPQTGLVYIPAQDNAGEMTRSETYAPDDRSFAMGFEADMGGMRDAQLMQSMMRGLMKGFLLAWDPTTQSKAWEVDHPMMGNGGTLATAGGLVFQGLITGDFAAFDAADGRELWRFTTQNGIVAAPVSYEAGGDQYVAIPAARGGGISKIAGLQHGPDLAKSGRILAFKLGGTAQLPAPRALPAIPAPPPMPEVAEETLAHGANLFSTFCGRCHGMAAVSDGSIADLRHLRPSRYDDIDSIVRGGVLKAAGMPDFPMLSEQDVAAIRAYLIEQANEDVKRREAGFFWDVRQAAYDLLADWLF